MVNKTCIWFELVYGFVCLLIFQVRVNCPDFFLLTIEPLVIPVDIETVGSLNSDSQDRRDVNGKTRKRFSGKVAQHTLALW